jgi:phospholipase A2
MKKTLALLLCANITAHAFDHHENLYKYYQRGMLKDLYHTIKPKISSIKHTITSIPGTILSEWIPEHQYQNEDAIVRFADFDELCKAEKQFTKQRLIRVKNGISTLLNTEITHNQIPRIAVCCSGGGHRAMLLTFGFLKGLQDIGLLDCVTYMSGLSGSTWAMAPWVASKQSLDSYITSLPSKLSCGLEAVKHPRLLHSLGQHLISKAAHGQFISMIDIMGPTLANTLLTDFGNNRLDITMSESHAHIADGSIPLPIYTAVTPNVEPYEWLEFTPFEIGSSYLKAYVPTWAYGRKFKHGRSVNYAAEQSLGYLMGIFGSAFALDIEDVIRHTSEDIASFTNQMPKLLQSAVNHLINDLIESPLDNVRLAPSSLPNFTYKTTTRPLNKDKTLTLIDAGIHFNLPLPPLLRDERQVDIILVCDASGEIVGCKNLRWVQEYMQAKKLNFPPIDFETADKKIMSIFRDEHDATCPIVVYFPRIKNENYSLAFDPETCTDGGYCETLNFTYNEKQIQELMGLSEFAVKQHAHELVSLTQEIVNNKA